MVHFHLIENKEMVNVRLVGVVWVLVLVTVSFNVEAEELGFVETKGLHFVANGSIFFANGYNAYWLMTMASDPSQRAKVTSGLSDASRHGLTVARTWAFSDGGGSNALQTSPGTYNEKTFQVPSCIHSFFS